MTAVWDVIAFIAALIGGFLVLSGFTPEASAPQQAAAASMGIGIAAIPYFIASMARRQEASAQMKRLIKASENAAGIENETITEKAARIFREQVG